MSGPIRADRPEQASRREFLKTSTVAAAGVVAGGLALGRSAHAAGTDTLKVGLVGCGGRGTGAAQNALEADPQCTITALADAFDGPLKTCLASLKTTAPNRVTVDADHCFTGFDAYRNVIESGVDVVLLAAPPHFRPIHLKACVEAGKHVFCEKPVAVDAPGVRSIMATVDEVDRRGLCLVSGLCWRYFPATQEIMKRVLDGAIGDVVSIHEVYNTGATGRQYDRRPEWTEMEHQLRNWYYFAWLSGDHNVEQHVHSLDKGSWAMGDRPPVRAWGLGGRQVRTDPKFGDVFDHHAVVYEYANGTRMHAYCRQQAGCPAEVTDTFFGTKGTCNVLNDYRITGESAWRADRALRRGQDMYTLEHKALFEAIRAAKPINNGHYMATSTMLGVLGRMATYSGAVITWEEALASNRSLAPTGYSWDADPPTLPDEQGRYPIAMPGVTRVL